MDMDFFNDQILTDLDRADYVGGIDNEAIFFEDLQVTTGIGRLAGNVTPPNIATNLSNVAGEATAALACSAKTETPVTSPTSAVVTLGGDIVLPSIPSVSARVSLQATPHIGIHSHNSNSNSNNSSNTHTHLPESPPDSGSEPPYSPMQDVQGLTLTTRDIFHHNGGGGVSTITAAGAAAAPLNDLNMTGAQHQHHHQQQQQQHVHHIQQQQLQDHSQNFVHLQENPTMRLNSLASPGHDPNLNAIRVKHETGLIINPNSLAQTLNSQNLHHSHQQPHHQQQHQQHHNHHANHHHLADTHIEIPGAQSQLQYSQHPSSNALTYDSLTNKLYGGGGINNSANPPGPPPPSYQISLAHMDIQQVDNSTCMLTSIGDLPHVQVIGTSHASLPSTPTLSRASAPSTPNHQSSSRKRKMTTQIDCPDFACVKPDPGLMMSPSRSSMCGTPLPIEVIKRSSISPLNIQVGMHDNITDTPAHSSASLSPALSSVNMDGSVNGGGGGVSSQKSIDGSANGSDALSPCIQFTPFQPQDWHELADQNLQEVKVSFYRVDADKGFNFSVSDDAFVCQKKNHFQITCHARLQNEAKFVKTPTGLEKIKSFHLHFYGVKLEAPNQTIRIEQSQSDRSKKPFYPVPIDLQSHIVSKVTVGRLHFSETTNNNMRKKGRPNPEQRYFQLVVGLHVHTASGDYPIVSQGSDKIIVRASNPGQFESDVDLCWQRGLTQDSVFHAGRVGINTDRPDESLVVHGNLKISGHIVQPSDSRAKQEIGELDTSVQLRNLQKIRIVRYRLEPEFALHSGLKSHRGDEDIVDTGVIAQEVREVIPDAVQEAGSVVLPNGNVIENFLLVNKDRILMENIGAVKELCNITGTLETRIENLERVNHRLQRVKENDLQFMQCKNLNAAGRSRDGYEICSNRTLQIIIFLLVIVMAACLAAVSTLYFVEHNKKQHNFKHLESIQLLSNGHIYGHEGLSLMEQERLYLQQILKSNRTHSAWPSLTYHSSATGVARSHSQNGTQPYRGEGPNFGSEFSYFDTQEDLAVPPTSQQSGRNDDITVVMEKPSVLSHELLQSYQENQRTTTSPLANRANKTVNSKHKHKWPQAQTVLRVMQTATSRNALPATRDHEGVATTNEDPNSVVHNNSETSTEKISDVILVQQDFENNSIDTDSQQTVDRPKANANAKKRLPPLPVSAEGGSHSEIQQLNIDSPVASTLRTVNEAGLRELNSPTQTNLLRHTNARGGDLIIYKTVPPPTSLTMTTTTKATTTTQTPRPTTATKVNTDAPHTNYSLETQPISNKSRNYVERNPDNSDNDLQSLTSNTNESVFNSGDPVDYDLALENRQSLLGARRSSSSALINGNQQISQSTGQNIWVQSSTVFVDVFGEPEQCNNQVKREDISKCQSVCFEENNQLLSPNQPTFSLKQPETKKTISLQQEEIDNENHSESEDNDAIIHEPDDDLQATYGNNRLLNAKIDLNTNNNNNNNINNNKNTSSLLSSSATVGQGLKTSHATQALAKQLNEDDDQEQQQQQQQQQQSESEGINFDAILEHNFSDDENENLDADLGKLKKSEKSDDLKGQPNLSVEPNRPPLDADCWKIRSCILAERLNNTFAFDDYCPKLGKSMNLTYVIPLSRFFKEQSIELHLTSSLPLQWVLCNIHEHSKINGKHLINSSNPSLSTINGGHQSQNVLQRRRNTSLLLLNVPSRGYFVKDLILRATSDPEKTNVCQEMPHDSNTILQYNFRILRNCD